MCVQKLIVCVCFAWWNESIMKWRMNRFISWLPHSWICTVSVMSANSQKAVHEGKCWSLFTPWMKSVHTGKLLSFPAVCFFLEMRCYLVSSVAVVPNSVLQKRWCHHSVILFAVRMKWADAVIGVTYTDCGIVTNNSSGHFGCTLTFLFLDWIEHFYCCDARLFAL